MPWAVRLPEAMARSTPRPYTPRTSPAGNAHLKGDQREGGPRAGVKPCPGTVPTADSVEQDKPKPWRPVFDRLEHHMASTPGRAGLSPDSGMPLDVAHGARV